VFCRDWIFTLYRLITETTEAGILIEARGVDLLEFENGKIIRKDSYGKLVE
jgi:hypothetical protein